MIIEIISIGNELVFGRIVDSNAAYLSRRFSEEGLNVSFHTVVGDEPEHIKNVFRLATERADLIVATGGLGPTKDDLTRHVIADLFKLDLVFDEGVWKGIRSRFAKRSIVMPENNRVQAMMPCGAVVIPNNTGTASGFLINIDNKKIITLPGVPSEMKLMVDEWVVPHINSNINSLCPDKDAIEFSVIKELKTFGIAESLLGEKIAHVMGPDKNPIVGTQASINGIIVRLCSSASSKGAAQELIGGVEREVKLALGDSVFGSDDESLEGALYNLLKAKSMTIALAESCTGGLVSNLLTNISGISEYLIEGVVTYSNESKINVLGVLEDIIVEHGAVSNDVAAAMASGVRKHAGTDIGIGITGIAGPSGGTVDKPVGLVYIAVDIQGDVVVKRNLFSGSRTNIKKRAAYTALNMARLRLLE